MEHLMKRWEGVFDENLSTESLETLIFSIWIFKNNIILIECRIDF
jgi:hypothetical protein